MAAGDDDRIYISGFLPLGEEKYAVRAAFHKEMNGLTLELTNFTDAWKGELSEWKDGTGNKRSWSAFRADAICALTQSDAEYRVHVQNANEWDLSRIINWTRISLDGTENVLGSVILKKAADSQTIIRAVLTGLLERKKNLFVKKKEMKESYQTIQMDFQTVLDETKLIVDTRSKEFRDILACSKLLLDSKRKYQSRLNEKTEFDAKAKITASTSVVKPKPKKIRKRKL